MKLNLFLSVGSLSLSPLLSILRSLPLYKSQLTAVRSLGLYCYVRERERRDSWCSMALFATSSRGAFLPLPKRASPLLASDESSSESNSLENDCEIVGKGQERNGASGRTTLLDFALCAACGIPAELSAASLRTLRRARGVAPVCAACVKEGKARKAGLVMAAVLSNGSTSLLAAEPPDFPGTQVRIRIVGIQALYFLIRSV